MWKSSFLLASLLVLSLSCSSLPPAVSSADTSPAVEKPQTNETAPSESLRTIEELKAELKSLRALLQTLKNTAGNLTPLLQTFEERLSSLQESNAKLRAALTTASESLTELTLELESLKADFAAYRQTVAENKLRDGLIIGGSCAAGGLLAGLIIGLLVGK